MAWIAWTPDEDAILLKSYHLEKPATLARRIERECGTKRSPTAVQLRARRLGLDTRRSDVEFSVKETAETLGTAIWNIYHLAEKGVIKPKGRGKNMFITLEDFEKLEALYPAPPERSYTKTQAIRILGYSETHITRLLKAGALRGVRRGERWYVDADHVDALVAEMKRTGETRRDWGDLPHLNDERRKCREYWIERRARERATGLSTG